MSQQSIGIVDYGVGNVASIANMVSRVGLRPTLSRDFGVLSSCDGLILPGVGAFDACAKNLKAFGLTDTLDKLVYGQKIPVLGICVGMQLLGNSSEEGVESGLGWIPGACKHFSNLVRSSQIKIPKMGWDYVNVVSNGGLQLEVEQPRFYFVHSYYFVPQDASVAWMQSAHDQNYVCAVQSGHVFGVQFHPEKSHRYGMSLFQGYAAYLAGRSRV